METLPKHYKRQRKKLRLLHLKPREAIRWCKGAFLSFFERERQDFPRMVSIEVTNNCNIACNTCPQPYIQEEKGYLNMGLFRKVIDECSQHPTLRSIVFTGFGEPLLHPQLIAMSRYVKSKGIPNARTYTNGVLLNKQTSDKLLLESGFDEITLSLNAPTQEIYKRIKNDQLYNLVTENIEYFLMRRKFLRKKTLFVNLQLLKLNNISYPTEDFNKKWMPLLMPGDCITIKYSHSFAGQVNDPGVGKVFGQRERSPCAQLSMYLFVSWNGDVIPCCVDPFKKLKIGNIGDSSLKDLWHSSKIKLMREIHIRKEYHRLPLCSNCETWRYFL